MINLFSYALRDLSGSEFNVFSVYFMVWSLKHDESRYCAVKRRIVSGEDGDEEHPLRDLLEVIKSVASTSNKDDKTKCCYLNHFFGGIKKQNITNTTTMADGEKVKKMIET